MGIFSFGSKKITVDKFRRQVKPYLREQGFSDLQVDRVELLAQAHMKESGSASGIDRREADQFIKNLEDNRSDHNFSREDMGHIRDAFNAALK